MGKFGNTSSVLIRHDYKRACYRAMLSEFTIEEVKEYFGQIPLLLDGRQIKGIELFELLWREKAKIPLTYDYALDNTLEKFLVNKGKEVPKIMEKILWLSNKGTYIPAKVLLSWFYPKLEAFFTSIDCRDMVFSLVPLFTENFLPGHIHRRVKRSEEGDTIKSILVYISDPTFNEYLDFDLELIAGPQIINGPVVFDLPPFEGFGMLSDCRPAERIVWKEEDFPLYDDSVLRIGGEAFGEKRSFLEFCGKKEIDLSKFQPRDLIGFEMIRDYCCPMRRRVVLHKGCFYGAPFFLHWVTHRRLDRAPKNLMKTMIAELDMEESMQNIELERRHLALLETLRETIAFTYYSADESLSLNGQHFISSIPAKIMRKLLSAYIQDGKTDFEYRELKREFEISLGQKNSNFEIRFYRLVEKINGRNVPLRIEKTGRGRFRLKLEGRLIFTEEAGSGLPLSQSEA